MPGNFHVSTHAYGDLVIALEMQGYSFDFSYMINHVSFGKQEDMKLIQRKFSNLGVLNPLDGLKVQADFSEAEQRPYNVQTNFYLIAVPSYFKDSNNNQYNVYQLTANYQTDLRAQQDLLMFNYELSPITVMFSQDKESFVEFLVHICAIVGGIFTIAGIIDAMIHRSVSAIFKQRIGKLS